MYIIKKDEVHIEKYVDCIEGHQTGVIIATKQAAGFGHSIVIIDEISRIDPWQ